MSTPPVSDNNNTAPSKQEKTEEEESTDDEEEIDEEKAKELEELMDKIQRLQDLGVIKMMGAPGSGNEPSKS